MKKTGFVLTAAVIMVFAFTANAMANMSSGTIDWDTAKDIIENQNPSPATPHKGYAQATTKCLVCHAVHKADDQGEVLLGAKVASACDYCHVVAAGISRKHVYNDTPANYMTDTPNNHGGANLKCTGCHSVHGANTLDQADYSSAILKVETDEIQTGIPTTWDITADGSDGDGALSAFCTQCHPYYTGTYADSLTGGDIKGSVFGPQATETYNSHIMTSEFGSYDPANGATKTGIKVAWDSSAYCTSCHDAGSGTAADNFPHMTDGARFMKSAAHAGVALEDRDDAGSATEDGVCLKCHVSADGGLGVGVNF